MTSKNVITRKLNKLILLAGALILGNALSGCDAVYEDLEECQMGVSLRFVYEYNMLRANAFAPEVDCVTVLVFDNDGNYVKSETETTDVLMDESYRMPLVLDPGQYHLVVYGGLTCEDATFDFAPDWIKSRAATGTVNDIRVNLPADEHGVSSNRLQDLDKRQGGLFYGTLDLSIDRLEDFNGVHRRVETVSLMKDNNNIMIMLQQIHDTDDMDVNDYTVRIVDDNFLLDGTNRVLATNTGSYTTSYLPFEKETRIAGYVGPEQEEGSQADIDETKLVKVACFELATSRLVVEHMQSARLIVTTNREHEADGSEKEIINIPLISYLTQARPFSANWIKGDREKGISPDQEFLDRQDTWQLLFFLNKDLWVKTHISVNTWIVRVNDIVLGF